MTNGKGYKSLVIKELIYNDLLGVKGELIVTRKKNVSFSDVIDHLIKFYTKRPIE